MPISLLHAGRANLQTTFPVNMEAIVKGFSTTEAGDQMSLVADQQFVIRTSDVTGGVWGPAGITRVARVNVAQKVPPSSCGTRILPSSINSPKSIDITLQP